LLGTRTGYNIGLGLLFGRENGNLTFAKNDDLIALSNEELKATDPAALSQHCAGTEAEALARKAEIDSYVDLDSERRRLARRIGVDADLLVLDELVSPTVLDVTHTAATLSPAFARALVGQSHTEDLTVRDLLTRNAGGHRYLVGSPESVADDLELWFRSGAADGFNLNIDRLPDGLSAFVDHVVPILQSRGIFRTEYGAATLRGNLVGSH
jgi:alkanesulfonate monooxygenase SsuD/methylene tetrahydromethanopterin reductase-like flavin-dependent oxidoreductase (luciferase family)